jgi:hypothetical protein
MAYSIELYFENEFEEKLRSLWSKLAIAGVPSVLQKIGSRPHLSLLILDRCNVDHVAYLIQVGIKDRFAFPLTFPTISLIPGEQQSVLLTPVINSGLIEIQQSLYNLLKENKCSIREHYKPHSWLPHCSISKELSPIDALKTIEICQNSSAIGKTMITEVGFIEFRPRKEIKIVGPGDNNVTSHNDNPLHRDSAALLLHP